MPKNKFSRAFFLITLLFLAFSLACRQNTTEQKATSTTQTKPSNSADPSSGEKSSGLKVKIKTPDDKPVVEVKFDGGDQVEYGGKVLRGEKKDAEKRKYSVEGGSQIAEVKAAEGGEGGGGFKVRTPDGKLLWKVKISPDKVKISDNEENQNAFELVKKQDGAKIEQNESRLGEVKFYPDRQKIKVKDAADREVFDGNTDQYSVAYGVLLLDKIPEELRYIILAELLSRRV